MFYLKFFLKFARLNCYWKTGKKVMSLGFIAYKLIQQYFPFKVMFRHAQMLSILENEVLAVRHEPIDVTIIAKIAAP